ncbi:MAG: adenylosuccinate lyase [Firmicutes bacterium HGW-Firmicutes-12]|jgi:adenylosuccinate lyase|nr:MAG: adenylosuccinate lyase [Firmicutes bacterium HGW-Firmicutes-12]
MIERYTMKEIGKIWTEENRWGVILEIEVLACEAMAELNLIPLDAARIIREKAGFNIERIREIEETTRHDVIAFLTNVAEHVGDEAKYIHMGMTSSDVLDTALSVQMKQAGELILEKLVVLSGVLKEKAVQYKDALMMGRSHGVHAEPVTFGLKMALWYTENERNIARMKEAIKTISVGKISGAVGTFANISPHIEEYVCEKMSLEPALVATQVIQRDRHAHYLSTLAVIASTLDKFATEIRHLQRTEVLEAEEPFAQGQKGSSAMPHKRNPVMCERISGLSRIIRSNSVTAFENVVLWHERDISHSSAERIILPDSTIALYYILDQTIKVMRDLKVNTDNMKDNVTKTLGLVFSQRVMLALVEKGLAREQAYQLTQRNAMIAWDEKKALKELVLEDAEIMNYLLPAEVESLFDYEYHLKNIDYILKRAGLFV